MADDSGGAATHAGVPQRRWCPDVATAPAKVVPHGAEPPLALARMPMDRYAYGD